MDREVPSWVAGLLVAVIVIAVVAWTQLRPDPVDDRVPLTELLAQVEDGEVTSAVFDENGTLTVTDADGEEQVAALPIRAADPVLEQLLASGVEVDVVTPSGRPFIQDLLLAAGPILILGLLLYVFIGRSNGIGSSRFDAATRPTTRLDDVIGADEAVDDATELVQWLNEPARYERVGATPPTGILLVGPPGVGKTLLARAVAGQTGIPFFNVSGSDFVEVFAGLGTRRVKSLFARAAKAARTDGAAVVFIDELDAIGRKRGPQVGIGSQSEAEQTLNALLVAMDGFSSRERVVVMAATNRPDVLDPALTRPGRFDRQITFGLPDLDARRRLLDLALDKLPARGEVDTDRHARRLAGASGADLVNVVNQAALVAAREGADLVTDAHVEAAWTRVTVGAPRPTAIVAPEDRRTTAVHEAGHALVGLLLDDAPDPTRVSILPHGGGVGGVTATEGSDRTLLSRAQADARLQVLMAGRAAEEVVGGPAQVTNGAESDIAVATNLAKAMTSQWGWGTAGVVRLEDQATDGPTSQRVTEAAASMLGTALDAAVELLIQHRPALDRLTEALLERDTLTREEIAHAAMAADRT